MSKIIDLNSLIEFYKKAYFPMADSKYSEEIKFYKPKLRFIIPISNFQYPKKLFNEFKKSKYSFKIDQDFAKVIELCKEIKRKDQDTCCLLYTSPSPRDRQKSRMPSSA